MDATEDRQLLEITALKSIYDDSFQECPPPKAWKGAPKINEFIIRVRHRDDAHAARIHFNLHIRLPKTYPTLATPIFTIQQPLAGLKTHHITKLTSILNAEAQKLKGTESVFQAVEAAQDWLEANVAPPVEPVGSLATQMTRRAMEEEEARRAYEQALASEAHAREAQRALELEAQIRADAEEREQMYIMRRGRASSDATEVPGEMVHDYGSSEGSEGEEGARKEKDVETFGRTVEWRGARFSEVRVYSPVQEGLGTVWLAEPVLRGDVEGMEKGKGKWQMEMLSVTFDTRYYSTTQGRKKLNLLTSDIQRLTSLRHDNLIDVLAVKLSLPHTYTSSHTSVPIPTTTTTTSPRLAFQAPSSSSSPTLSPRVPSPLPSASYSHDGTQTQKHPQLHILTERRPAITLSDVLEECGGLREERAGEYLTQVLSALDALHSADIVHRGLSLRCIGLSASTSAAAGGRGGGGGTGKKGKRVKIFGVGYVVKLGDMNRSEPFSSASANGWGVENAVPESWLSKDVLESPLEYTKARDLHDAGIVLLQMLLGKDVMGDYPDYQAALATASLSRTMHQYASSLLVPTKRQHVSAHAVLADIAGTAIGRALRTPSIAINGTGPKTPTWQGMSSSPDSVDYFKAAMAPAGRARGHVSRWKEDWEELELLGRGAFGSVVKARNRIDNRIYAVKKIRLKANQSDQKIFREVTALARLYHRNIVRYYTTWVESSEAASNVTSTVGSSAGTSVPASSGSSNTSQELTAGGEGEGEEDSDPFVIDLNELNSGSVEDRHSFPSIHFTRSATPESSESGPSDELFDDGIEFGPPRGEHEKEKEKERANGGRTGTATVKKAGTPVQTVTRTLYIQMEFVERQTLKERIAEGLSEEEAWRLFQQILDALVHMSSMSILHRDIKLTNIFIDGKGDCKIGDFGLATSSLAAVDPSDVSTSLITDTDMTLDVGTRLYIAPEVQSSHRKPRGQNHAKADMYSLGIVFFEMNHAFSTGSERIAVLEGLRKPDILFPKTWDPRRTRQQQIIAKLLNHNPDQRPSAVELAQDPLLPPRIEDEYYLDILKKMAEPNSAHRQSVLTTLFSQRTKASRAFLYDNSEEPSDHTTLNGIVHDRMVEIFRMHGAVDMEPPLLMPMINPEDDGTRAMFLDRNGDVIALPNNAFSPFGRLAARINLRRIKRYHICNLYRPDLVAGHPKATKAAMFDIISQDLHHGSSASAAEAIAVVNECLDSFANLDKYEIHISHTKIQDALFESIPEDQRVEVVKILAHTDASRSQRRPLLAKKGLTRVQIDALDVFSEMDTDVDAMVSRLEKVAPHMVSGIAGAIREVKSTIEFASTMGVGRPIYFHPLYMIRNPSQFFKGLCFEVARKQSQKRADVLAVGGRYDHVINRYIPGKAREEDTCAVAVQISMEKITVALASFQSQSLKSLKERRLYGFWSPRRCDVYVVSHQEGSLSDRLEVTALLWKHKISADMMYEVAMQNLEHQNVVEQCAREGILFIVYPRPRTARREQAAFRVKSVLRGTEEEVSKQDLVSYLQQQIAEQKRLESSTAGVQAISESTSKETANTADISVVVPLDVKKKVKVTKAFFTDRAYDFATELVNAANQNNIPTVVVDVPPNVFTEMRKSTDWLTDDEAFKGVIASFPTPQAGYANQIREAVLKRKASGTKFLILFALREEEGFVIQL